MNGRICTFAPAGAGPREALRDAFVEIFTAPSVVEGDLRLATVVTYDGSSLLVLRNHDGSISFRDSHQEEQFDFPAGDHTVWCGPCG
jgi:hypothetical protein